MGQNQDLAMDIVTTCMGVTQHADVEEKGTLSHKLDDPRADAQYTVGWLGGSRPITQLNSNPNPPTTHQPKTQAIITNCYLRIKLLKSDW